jgi:glycosyltransferase involved in cell wall biosynthesis
MRVLIADPPAYTPPYDYALAAALVRNDVNVRLLTSRFRFGAVPDAEGFTVDDSLYRVSSGLSSSRARLVVKALEHPLALARLGLSDCDLLHLQWVAAPEADGLLLHTRRPLVFTAHDLLPRRTARHTRTWKRLFGRFDRIVAHSDRGRRTLEAFGVSPGKLRVIPHPAFRSDPARHDDGRTVLALGVIRPYKGLPDAIEAVGRIAGARLLVAGDPRIPIHELKRQAGDRAEWRLGYLGEDEMADVLGATTVAVFPYRAELDQSGALLQVLGAGIPAVVYDVGGLGEIVGAFGAGRVVEPGDVDGLERALRELLDNDDELAGARAGAAAARESLTWDRSGAAHRALYEELV